MVISEFIMTNNSEKPVAAGGDNELVLRVRTLNSSTTATSKGPQKEGAHATATTRPPRREVQWTETNYVYYAPGSGH